MSNIIKFKSITEIHSAAGLDKPKHPLISVYRHHPDEKLIDYSNMRITSDLFSISMKDGIKGTFGYGRNTYDFDEGAMIFLAPGQAFSIDNVEVERDNNGWMLMFHPDLIRKSNLGKTIEEYSFFDYDVNEALHLSDKEKQTINDLVIKIEEEIDQNIDQHTQNLVISNLELLLNYCTRYYDRQFYTRSNMNKDIVSKFEDYLKKYFKDEEQIEHGIPSVKYCAEQMNMSSNYLGDMLKKETGRNSLDHIHSFIVEKAKTILLSTTDSISEIAYSLGFEYSQHFSKLFKKKTGMSPGRYRVLN